MPDGLVLVETALGLVLAAVLIPLAALIVRRRVLASRGWLFDCSQRPLDGDGRRPWIFGLARLNGEQLEWFRAFSISMKPALVLRRGGLSATSRPARPRERATLYDQERVLGLQHDDHAHEFAMVPSAMTAVLAWLEAAPPGGATYRFR